MNAAGIAAVKECASASTDSMLVAAVRAGDDAAFEELFRRYRQPVGAFVRRHVRDHGRAEDVTQEAFVSALRRMRQTDSEIAFRPWIYEIARNASIDLYRRTSRAQEVSIDVEGGLPPGDAGRLSGGPGPQATVLGKERFDNLRGALDELSEPHHRIIVMRELEGLTYREIGDRMELSPTAVESMLFRARRRLEQEYAQIDSGRRCRLVGAAIGRLAEGLESDRDRRRLDRHARRCSGCRRRARQLGVEPLLARRGLGARAAALLPLPAFVRRRSGAEAGSGTGVQQTLSPLGAAVGPGVEAFAASASKAVAVVVAAAAIGGGGATLGGVGPLAVERGSGIERLERPGSSDRGVPDGRSPLSGPFDRQEGIRPRRSVTGAPAPSPSGAPDRSVAGDGDPRAQSTPRTGAFSLPALPPLDLPLVAPPPSSQLKLRSAPGEGDREPPPGPLSQQQPDPYGGGIPASPVPSPPAAPPSGSESPDRSTQADGGSGDEGNGSGQATILAGAPAAATQSGGTSTEQSSASEDEQSGAGASAG